jgi:hypothetical protein
LLNRILVPALPALLEAHPLLQPHLVAGSRNLSLTNREADIALRFARPDKEQRAVAFEFGSNDRSGSWLRENASVQLQRRILFSLTDTFPSLCSAPLLNRGRESQHQYEKTRNVICERYIRCARLCGDKTRREKRFYHFLIRTRFYAAWVKAGDAGRHTGQAAYQSDAEPTEKVRSFGRG